MIIKMLMIIIMIIIIIIIIMVMIIIMIIIMIIVLDVYIAHIFTTQYYHCSARLPISVLTAFREFISFYRYRWRVANVDQYLAISAAAGLEPRTM